MARSTRINNRNYRHGRYFHQLFLFLESQMTHDPREALEPCPFCGGEAERIDVPTVGSDPDLGGDPNAGGSYIQCKRCVASTALHFDRKENLYSSWNERMAGVAEKSGAGAPETSVRCGAPAALTASAPKGERHPYCNYIDGRPLYIGSPPPAAGWDDDTIEDMVDHLYDIGIIHEDNVTKARRALEREALRREAPAPSGEALADWSELPKDIYVIGARRVNAVGFDVQCCSVPMVTAPEVRYVRADMIAALSTPSNTVNESAEARLREAILASIDMINFCHDAPTNPDSLPQMVKVHLQQALSAGGDGHDSDCALHNEPAYPNGSCNCSAAGGDEAKKSEGAESQREGQAQMGPVKAKTSPSALRAGDHPSDPPDRREIVARLLTTAKLLFQNAVGCATNHYGHDCELNGLPGWLRDCERDIKAADTALDGGAGE